MFFLNPRWIRNASTTLQPRMATTRNAIYDRGKKQDSRTRMAAPRSSHVESEKLSLNTCQEPVRISQQSYFVPSVGDWLTAMSIPVKGPNPVFFPPAFVMLMFAAAEYCDWGFCAEG